MDFCGYTDQGKVLQDTWSEMVSDAKVQWIQWVMCLIGLRWFTKVCHLPHCCSAGCKMLPVTCSTFNNQVDAGYAQVSHSWL